MSIQELKLQLFRAKLSLESAEKTLNELEKTYAKALCFLCEARSLITKKSSEELTPPEKRFLTEVNNLLSKE